ncbi:hypothetical protein PRUPE_2G216700 [Prunus persica]|uniref:SAP domain-containing protein n=1 Tax=Prunus persica TaxID=3760 RepID=A0A251QJI6_PRUPE|nr:hypothetical protein PRUPE_2G216700 [Prunus persica]ONI23946.1 hypothetical protein PRUPE_2G216700 [Prunus persica]ONI23947.1 hypothetical protein PRUPE_2G216700 [Prunus persica]ONI23948.1 hypothetical protein PRUPE_2G216700 [Prunus persica]ONI23949.1 hypothetical protein PRUPE_2G216700 [Prunus persica]
MDLVAHCKGKLASFRIKELKDVLTQLGLPKQGRKQDLVERILALVSGEETSNTRHLSKEKFIEKKEVAEIINEAYRKMQIVPSTDSASKEQSGSDTCSVKPKKEVKNFSDTNAKICCPCGSSLSTEAMIQCVDPRCQVQQHIHCVIIPEKTTDCNLPVRPLFFCEMCRLKRADPFWVNEVDLLSPVKLVASNIPIDGANPTQNVEKTFQLSRANKDLLQDNEYDVQAWCMLLNDSVPFRMQWPQFADLQVNGMSVRTVNRPEHQLLGANGRDDGALVLNLIPKEEDGELFEDALARVCRCIGGGPAKAPEDSDSDLEVISDSVSVNLRCPMSGCRMKVAGRFKPCVHMGCFDLDTFVELNQRSRKMLKCGEDITEINVKPDGSWSAKTKGEFSDLAQWHLPDGSLCAGMNLETSRQFKLESCTNEHSGFMHNPCGVTEVSGHQHGPLEEEFEVCSQNVITMSSSATGSGRDDEGMNQNCNVSANDDNEINSASRNFDPTFAIMNGGSAQAGNADIIILSDSEEEDVHLVSPGTVYNTLPVGGSGCSLSVPPGFSGSYAQDPALKVCASSSLGLFNETGNDIGMSQYPYPSGTEADPGFQLFGTDSDISDAFIDLEQTEVARSAPTNGNTLVLEEILNPSRQVLNSSGSHANADLDNSLVDDPLAFVSEDGSLQNFLPTQPSGLLEQSDSGQHPPDSNGINTEDWMSLRLGSIGEIVPNDIEACTESARTNELRLRNQCGSDKVALVKGLNNGARSKRENSRKFSDGPFSFPRQPRSVRQRVCLSIESNSE